MKINWGKAIAIFYICFMIAMISMVIKSINNPSDLVQENYYDKDIKYESFRLKKVNASRLDPGINIKYQKSKGAVQVTFPEGMEGAKGTTTLFRASNKYQDKRFEIKLDDLGLMTMPMDGHAAKGLWKVQVDWVNKGKEYYHEEEIIVK